MTWFKCLICIMCIELITKLNAECNGQDDTGVLSSDIDIQFSQNDCLISCQVDIHKSKTIYWIKFLKQKNNKFYDVVHIYRNGQSEELKWFNCTDLDSRFSVNESNLDAGILVLKSNSSVIRDSDDGIYKCEANSDTYSIHWNKTRVDWTDCHSKETSGESSCPKSKFLHIILTFLLFILYKALPY